MRLLNKLGSPDKGKEKGLGLSIAGLVLVAVVPLLVFGIGAAWIIADQKKNSITNELAGTARSLQVAVDSKLQSQFASMEMLAADASLDSHNPVGFQEQCNRALKANDDWLTIALIDPRTHRIILGSPSFSNRYVSSLSPESENRIIRSGKPLIVGAYRPSKIVKAPMILLLAPVIRENKVRYVLGVAMNPKALNDLFMAQRFAPAWTGAVLDAQMVLAGRSREPEQYVGFRATQTLVDNMATGTSGMFTALNLEGAGTYTVFSRSALTSWSVAIGVPAAEVEGPIHSVLLKLTATGGTLLALALLLAVTVGRNIVRRRNAHEQALMDSEYLFRTMSDSAPVFIWISDANKQCIWVNQVRRDFTGQALDQEIGAGWAESIHPDDADRCLETFSSAFDNRQPFVMEYRLRRADGEYRWFFNKGVPFVKQQIFKGYIGSSTDITDLKRAEIALSEAQTLLHTIVDSTDDLIWSLSMILPNGFRVKKVPDPLQPDSYPAGNVR